MIRKSIASAALLAAVFTLAACASNRSTGPGLARTDVTPSTAIAAPAAAGNSVARNAHLDRMSEAERREWFQEHGRPATNVPGRAYDQTLAPQVERVEYIHVERSRPWYPPVHLSLGYSHFRGHGRRRHHGGWHYGLGWGYPFYGW